MSGVFSWAKLVGSFFTGMHWVKVLSFAFSIGFLGFVGYGLYKAYVKTAEPTTTQSAEVIENYYHQPKATFGCATVKTYGRYPTNRMRR